MQLSNLLLSILASSALAQYKPLNGIEPPSIDSGYVFRVGQYIKAFLDFKKENPDEFDGIKNFASKANLSFNRGITGDQYEALLRLEEQLQKYNNEIEIPAWNYFEYKDDYTKDPALGSSMFGHQLNSKNCTTAWEYQARGPSLICIKRKDIKGQVPDLKEFDKSKYTEYNPFAGYLKDERIKVMDIFWEEEGYDDPLFYTMIAQNWVALSRYGEATNTDVGFAPGHPILYQ